MAEQLADLNEDVKPYLKLQVEDTSLDTWLGRLIEAASAAFTNWCNRRQFAAADYTERYSGAGNDKLFLRHRPVLGITSVAVDGQPIPASTDGTPGWLWEPDSSTVELIGYSFNRGKRNVQVVYRAGFDPIPADVTQAVCELVALKFKQRDFVGITAKHLGDEVVQYSEKEAPEFTRRQVQQFTTYPPA